jgi:hypothetical protein
VRVPLPKGLELLMTIDRGHMTTILWSSVNPAFPAVTLDTSGTLVGMRGYFPLSSRPDRARGVPVAHRGVSSSCGWPGIPCFSSCPWTSRPRTSTRSRQRLGFNDPLARPIRALRVGAARGDFGESLRYRATPSPRPGAAARHPELGGAALLLTFLVAIPIGVALRDTRAASSTTSAWGRPCSARPSPASGSASC